MVEVWDRVRLFALGALLIPSEINARCVYLLGPPWQGLGSRKRSRARLGATSL